jgi:hypothetical protein
MPENLRKFEAGPDPFGRTWQVEFQWLQNGISIRHADTVDVKYRLSCGEESRELVVALPHAALRELSRKANRPLTDPWCMRLAAMHLRHMIETAEDMEKTIVTPSYEDLEKHQAALAA